MGALSRSPVPAEPNQQPIVLDEFPEHVVLLVQSWDERVVAWPTRDGREGQNGRGRECTPCMIVQRLAERAQAQRRWLRRRRAAVPLVAQVQQVYTTPCEEADDDWCQVLLTDGEESDDADAACAVTKNYTAAAMLGAGEGGVALPKAFSNCDLVAAQAKDPDCLRCMPLVNKPRAQWPPHLAVAPLHFLYVADVLCVQVDDVVAGKSMRRWEDRTEISRSAHSALPRPPPHCATRGFSAARSTSAPPQLLWWALSVG